MISNKKFPEWPAEGERVLPDRRSVWDWINYNIRAHAILHSKSKAKERNERERQLQNNYEEAKKNLNCFTKKKKQRNYHSCGQGRVGMNMANVVQNTSSIFRKEKSC